MFGNYSLSTSGESPSRVSTFLPWVSTKLLMCKRFSTLLKLYILFQTAEYMARKQPNRVGSKRGAAKNHEMNHSLVATLRGLAHCFASSQCYSDSSSYTGRQLWRNFTDPRDRTLGAWEFNLRKEMSKVGKADYLLTNSRWSARKAVKHQNIRVKS